MICGAFKKWSICAVNVTYLTGASKFMDARRYGPKQMSIHSTSVNGRSDWGAKRSWVECFIQEFWNPRVRQLFFFLIRYS